MRLIASPRSLACLLVASLAACGSTPPSAPKATRPGEWLEHSPLLILMLVALAGGEPHDVRASEASVLLVTLLHPTGA